MSSQASFLMFLSSCLGEAVMRTCANVSPERCFASRRMCTEQQRGSEAVNLSSGISGFLNTSLRRLRSLTIQVHTSESSNQNIIGNLT